MLATDKQTGYPSVEKPWLKYYKTKTYDISNLGNLYDCVYVHNKNRLEKTILKYYGSEITGKQFFETINRIVYYFKNKGLKRGDVITLMSLVTPEALMCIYGLNYMGVVINSVYLNMSDEEIRATISDTNSKMLIAIDVISERVDKLSDSIPVDDIIILSVADSLSSLKKRLYNLKNKKKYQSNKICCWKSILESTKNVEGNILENTNQYGEDVAFIMYTSGSTGIPKGVELTNRAINSLAIQYIDFIEHREGETTLCFIPPFFSIGFSICTHMPLVLSLVLDICPDPTPEVVAKEFIKRKPNHFLGAPSNNLQILELLKGDCSYIKTFAAGGASATEEQENYANEVLKKHNSNAKFVTGYGMTEFAGTVTTGRNDVYLPFSLGLPLPLVNAKVIDIDNGEELSYNEIGELCFTSSGNMNGYYNQIDATNEIIIVDENGKEWIKTGDLGEITEDGYVFFRGRLKRIYLKKSPDGTLYKIFPQRLEELLLKKESINECAVIVQDDNEKLHKQIAYVVLGEKTDTVEDIISYCDEQLPSHMIPDSIKIITKMPYKSNGKIDYKLLENIDKNEE